MLASIKRRRIFPVLPAKKKKRIMLRFNGQRMDFADRNVMVSGLVHVSYIAVYPRNDII